MDERDHKAMNDELKKEQPSIELQISDEQLDKIKSCEVLKINGMEFISRTKTTEMLIKFANEQLKEKEEESIMLEKMCNRAQDHAEGLLKQLTKSNEMAVDFLEWVMKRYFIANNLYYKKGSDYNENGMLGEELLTEYQNSKT